MWKAAGFGTSGAEAGQPGPQLVPQLNSSSGSSGGSLWLHDKTRRLMTPSRGLSFRSPMAGNKNAPQSMRNHPHQPRLPLCISSLRATTSWPSTITALWLAGVHQFSPVPSGGIDPAQTICLHQGWENRVHCLYLVVVFLGHISRLFQSKTSRLNLSVALNCSSTIWWYQSRHNGSPSWRGNVVDCGVKGGQSCIPHKYTHRLVHTLTCERGERWVRSRQTRRLTTSYQALSVVRPAAAQAKTSVGHEFIQSQVKEYFLSRVFKPFGALSIAVFPLQFLTKQKQYF